VKPGSIAEQLLAELQGARAGTRALPSGTPSWPYYTGPGGLFGVQGVERDLISTRVQVAGLAARLPGRGTMMMNPVFPYLTGFLAPTGGNPNGVCDDPPTAGPGKNCMQMAQFGRYSFQTRELEINRVGQQVNRGEFQDLRLVNPPLLNDMGSMTTPSVPNNAELLNEAAFRQMELGIAFQDKLSRQVYEGNPANNTGGGGYAEFPGLDLLVGTGKKDAFTGATCPSLDSTIHNNNYALVQTGAQGDAFVRRLTYTLRYLKSLARDTNLDPVNWAVVMRSGLFYELTAIWPCVYMTHRCEFTTTDGTKQINVDAGDMIAMRDAMRQGNYLLVDGEQVEVILDNTIREDTNASGPASIGPGQFASDIYILPLSVGGGYASLFWEYLDYQKGAIPAANQAGYSDDYWTDGGRFLWHKKPPLNWCIQWLAKIEPRIILRTPHLAARILNVRYEPLIHERDHFTTDPYFVDGGVTDRRYTAGPSLYKSW
jgi:hypothetical protein